MTCPFFMQTASGEKCEALLDMNLDPSEKSESWICHYGWMSECRIFSELLHPQPENSNTSAEKKKLSSGSWRFGHVNRNGGLRSVFPDLF